MAGCGKTDLYYISERPKTAAARTIRCGEEHTEVCAVTHLMQLRACERSMTPLVVGWRHSVISPIPWGPSQ